MNVKALVPLTRGRSGDIRLLMRPYGGGSATAYRPLANLMPADIECYAAEYPGHGRRFDEEPVSSITTLAEEVAILCGSLSTKPYVLFGHSMGSYVVLEACRLIETSNLRSPELVVISGCRVPENNARRATGHLTPQEVVQRLATIGATPPEVLHDESLMSTLTKMFHADFVACDLYKSSVPEQIDSALAILIGRRDTYATSHADSAVWGRMTRGPCEVHSFDGGHFFIHSERTSVAATLTSSIRNAVHLRLQPIEPQQASVVR